jgi:hypothetical protein
MFNRTLALFVALSLAPAIAQERLETDPAPACVQSLYDSMAGHWRVVDEIGAPGAQQQWNLFRADRDTFYVQFISGGRGEDGYWLLTGRGVDYMRSEGRQQYTLVSDGVRINRCQEAATGTPGVIETVIRDRIGRRRDIRERIEVSADGFVIERTATNADATMISRQVAQRLQPMAVDPPPAPTPIN